MSEDSSQVDSMSEIEDRKSSGYSDEEDDEMSEPEVIDDNMQETARPTEDMNRDLSSQFYKDR